MIDADELNVGDQIKYGKDGGVVYIVYGQLPNGNTILGWKNPHMPQGWSVTSISSGTLRDHYYPVKDEFEVGKFYFSTTKGLAYHYKWEVVWADGTGVALRAPQFINNHEYVYKMVYNNHRDLYKEADNFEW